MHVVRRREAAEPLAPAELSLNQARSPWSRLRRGGHLRHDFRPDRVSMQPGYVIRAASVEDVGVLPGIEAAATVRFAGLPMQDAVLGDSTSLEDFRAAPPSLASRWSSTATRAPISTRSTCSPPTAAGVSVPRSCPHRVCVGPRARAAGRHPDDVSERPMERAVLRPRRVPCPQRGRARAGAACPGGVGRRTGAQTRGAGRDATRDDAAGTGGIWRSNKRELAGRDAAEPGAAPDRGRIAGFAGHRGLAAAPAGELGR